MKKLFKKLFKNKYGRTALCWLASAYIRLVYYTSRKRMDIDEQALPYMRGEKNAIFAFWHGRLLLMPMLRPEGRPMNVLISSHRDGEVTSRTMRHFGFGAIRGSSSRGGAGAAIGVVKALKAGENVSITPDGPRGPARIVQSSIMDMAQMAGVPVVAVTFHSTRARTMRTWDRFMVALPFGTLLFKIGAPLVGVGKDTLEAQMNRLTDEADGQR